ncbi:MAG: CHASE3 domain-containing protein [Sphingomonadaceae bacterium]|nr:CHASE3 domain-containing protein [Sphingomonadaceae bacterium]
MVAADELPKVAGIEASVERRFNRIVLGFMALAFTAVLAMGLAAGLVMALNQRHVGWVGHTYQVERQISIMRRSLSDVEAGLWENEFDGSAFSRERAHAGVAELNKAIAAIDRLTADNPRQQARLPLLLAASAQIGQGSAQVAAPGGTAAKDGQWLGAITQSVDLIRQIGTAMLADENRLLDLRTADQRASAASFYLVLALAGGLLILIGLASIFVIRRYTADLSASRAALRSLNENLEVVVQERTVDLQRANEEIQRFAYIVSHDLRSPLVNVMGFTAELDAAARTITEMIDKVEEAAPELVSKDAGLAAREDLPEAIRFIRTSTQKMDRLINAILRLSREGRRTLAPERVDIGALVGTIADSMKHRVDEVGAAIVVQPGLPSLTTDRLALEQILSNLIENAAKYLQPGRPGKIEVRGHTAGNRIIIDVADNGRGIEARDHQRVFDLFRRSGAQDQPGEGIGLAHVRALAYRLGGTIGLRSELGKGATFTVNLPAAYVAEQGAST